MCIRDSFYAILNGLIQLSLPVGVQAIIGYVLGASMRASLVVLIALVVLGVLIAGIMQINQMKIIEKIQQKLFVRYSFAFAQHIPNMDLKKNDSVYLPCLLYTSDAADERSSVDLGGRRIIKKKHNDDDVWTCEHKYLRNIVQEK